MHEAAVLPLPAWQNFYVIVGTAAATLTGLMFIVITLIAQLHNRRSNSSVAAFGTPTVVHFCVALAVAAINSAPWPVLWAAGLLLGLVGLGGVTYIGIIVQRLRSVPRQGDYQPVMEDWLFHAILPLAGYIILVVAAFLLPSHPTPALFGIGAVTLLLLFIGIHNSWDTVTFLAIQYTPSEHQGQDERHAEE